MFTSRLGGCACVWVAAVGVSHWCKPSAVGVSPRVGRVLLRLCNTVGRVLLRLCNTVDRVLLRLCNTVDRGASVRAPAPVVFHQPDRWSTSPPRIFYLQCNSHPQQIKNTDIPEYRASVEHRTGHVGGNEQAPRKKTNVATVDIASALMANSSTH